MIKLECLICNSIEVHSELEIENAIKQHAKCGNSDIHMSPRSGQLCLACISHVRISNIVNSVAQ